MGDSDGADPSVDDRNAERNAAIQARYDGLPAAGSLAYWAALRDDNPESRLPLEVLVRCVRERSIAGQGEQAKQVAEVLLGKIRGKLDQWIQSAIPPNVADREGLIGVLRQELAIDLWEEMTLNPDTHLAIGFWHKVKWMLSNAAKQVLIEAGVRSRENVQRPTRAPQDQQVSLDQPVARDEDGRTLGEVTPAPDSDPYEWIETTTDITRILDSLTPDERRLIELKASGDYTREELGAQFGISGRAIYDRLKKLQARLRQQYERPDDAHGEEK